MVLNEANEPEEEEDTHVERVVRHQKQQKSEHSPVIQDSLINIENVDVSEMKVKRRLQFKPGNANILRHAKRSPDVRIKAINALYGSDNTLEYLRNSLNANGKRPRRAP